tara:strand:+ start:6418 stop:6627 length:210 start_codon:yes stop_codon:yes gene_type:complete
MIGEILASILKAVFGEIRERSEKPTVAVDSPGNSPVSRRTLSERVREWQARRHHRSEQKGRGFEDGAEH